MVAKNYEGMFLVDNKFATRDWNDDEIQLAALLTKHGAEVLRARRWAERKLAYEIGPHKRAVYFLVYFKLPAQNVDALSHDLNLTDHVIRHLIIRHDDDQMAKILEREDAEAQRQATEGPPPPPPEIAPVDEAAREISAPEEMGADLEGVEDAVGQA